MLVKVMCLVNSVGEESVVVHLSTSDGKCIFKILEAKFGLLGRRLETRPPRLFFLDPLSAPFVDSSR